MSKGTLWFEEVGSNSWVKLLNLPTHNPKMLGSFLFNTVQAWVLLDLAGDRSVRVW